MNAEDILLYGTYVTHYKISTTDCVDSMQLTYWVLDSGATYHTTLDISDFIPGPMVKIDKYIEGSFKNFSQQSKQENFNKK